MWSLVTFLINAYEDVYPLLTANKTGQLYGMLVFYCVVRFFIIPYGSYFVGIKISRILLSFLSMIIYKVLGMVFKI